MRTLRWRMAWLLILPPLTPYGCYLSSDEFRTLHSWLTCDECVNGERSAVAAIGPKAVAMLDSALIGPSRGRQAIMRAKGEDSFRFAQIAGQRSIDYTDARVANYVATYQKRAAVSLGDIGDKRAREALDRAIAESSIRHYRPDVLRVITFVRSTAWLPRFSGTIAPTRVAFGRVVSVVAPTGAQFNQTTRAGIADSPFPQNQVPFRRTPDTLQFLALADVGYHAVVVTNVTGTTDSAVAPLFVNSIRDRNDSLTAGCADSNGACVTGSAQPAAPSHVVPFLTFLTLQRASNPRDTVDFFKLEPAVATTYTARLDWYGAANLDLFWRMCNTLSSIGNTNGATQANPETTTVAMPAGSCWILQVTMAPGGANGNGPAFARLQVSTP